MAKTETPITDVVETYVKAVRAGDLALLRSVCADDMELVCRQREGVPTGRLNGADAIVAYYGQLLKERGGADPHPGQLMVVGDRVAVEIQAHHGTYIDEVADFFTIRNGKIVRLAVYSGPYHNKKP